jgi:aspartokinase
MVRNMNERLTIFPLKINRPLAMISFREVPDDEAATRLLFHQLDQRGVALDFLLAELAPSMRRNIVFCVSQELLGALRKDLDRFKGLVRVKAAVIEEPVAVVRILGPHFDIRPGIIALLMGKLVAEGIKVLATSTTITSSMLVVAETQLEMTVRLLRRIFHLPDTNRSI